MEGGSGVEGKDQGFAGGMVRHLGRFVRRHFL